MRRGARPVAGFGQEPRHGVGPAESRRRRPAGVVAGHASTRTTQLYDRRRELIEPEEIERVQF